MWVVSKVAIQYIGVIIPFIELEILCPSVAFSQRFFPKNKERTIRNYTWTGFFCQGKMEKNVAKTEEVNEMKQFRGVVAFSLMVVMMTALLGSAVAFAGNSKIGVINPQAIMAGHPKLKDVQSKVKTALQQKQSEAKIAIDAESDNNKKAKIFQKKREEAAMEEKKLMDPLFKEIDLAIRTVAKAKKLEIVLDNTGVFYGGVDITNDVIQYLKKNAK